MMWKRCRWGAVVAATALGSGAGSGSLVAQGPPPEVRAAVDALVRTLEQGSEASAAAFVEARLTPAYRNSLGSGAVRHVVSLQQATRGALDNVGLERSPDGSMRMTLSGSQRVVLTLVLDSETGRFDRIDLVTGEMVGGPGLSAAANDHLMALEVLAPTEAAVAEYRSQRLAPSLRARADEVDPLLLRAARAAQSAGMVMSGVEGPYHLLRFGGGGTTVTVRILVGETPPHLIEELSVEEGGGVPPEAARPVAWDEMDAYLRAQTDWGFSGTVLAVREGEVVLHGSYGLANRETGQPIDTSTVFDIGSQPIDFTRAAIWLLVQRGALSMDDPITRFYPDAPADKRSLTIGHLMRHESGLPNFHHVASDDDWDLTWVDRATAERRILGSTLLFPPGTDRSPSHSAFGLLAAITERVSGRSYEDFLRTEFFEPIGMHRTGPYGDFLGLPESEFAVGYGGDSVGDPNIPPNWGPTSWLIKGSGGMVSTPADLHRFFQAMLEGRILTGAAREGYLGRTSSTGATDRGFLFAHAWAGGPSRSMIFLSHNVSPDRPEAVELRRRLAATVGARLGGG